MVVAMAPWPVIVAMVIWMVVCADRVRRLSDGYELLRKEMKVALEDLRWRVK